jgi:hypothetical protein
MASKLAIVVVFFMYLNFDFLSELSRRALIRPMWLLENKFLYDSMIFAYATQNDNLDNMKWFTTGA